MLCAELRFLSAAPQAAPYRLAGQASSSTPARWGLAHFDSAEKEVTLVEGGDDVQRGRWYHLVATSDGENLKLYIDGRLVDSQRRRGEALDLGAGEVILGRRTANNRYVFVGSILSAGVWDRALSSAEVGLQFQAWTR